MQRDVLLLTEMIDAAEQAQALADGVTAEDLAADRQRRDALLWNFTVLGEAAGQLSDEIKNQLPAQRGHHRGPGDRDPQDIRRHADRIS
jgi:uncharacterized protein with HEPN domain